MQEIARGELIRNLRTEKGFTQERVAESGISPSTISQIENGSCNPSRGTINKIMMELGEPAFSCIDLYSARELEQKKLLQHIMLSLQRRDMKTASICLEELADTISSHEIPAKQFYFFMELVYQQMEEQIDVASEAFVAQCESILCMRKGTYEKLTRKMPLDKVEELLINAVALSRGLAGDYEFASKMYTQLYACSLKYEVDLVDRNATLAAIYGNFGWLLAKQGKYERALNLVNKAIALNYDGRGTRFMMRILQIRMAVFFYQENFDAYHSDYININNMCHLAPDNESPEKFENWLFEPSGILLF